MATESTNTPVEQPVTRQTDMAAISVASRLPDFWREQPRVWFLQVEAVLQPQHLSDETKYNLIVAKLDRDVILQVTDILSKPPSSGKFEALKSRLLNIYEESEANNIRRLISEMELGSQRPSQLLRQMRDLARNRIQDPTLTVLWQGHLPPTVKAVLAVTDKTDLDVLAAIADKVMDATEPRHVSSIEQSKMTTSDNNILAAIEKIGRRLDHLESRGRPSNNRLDQQGRSRARASSRNRSGSRSGSRHRRSPDDADWQCYYHFNYKEKANKCVKPCSYNEPTKN